jgi:hypothetical protein
MGRTGIASIGLAVLWARHSNVLHVEGHWNMHCLEAESATAYLPMLYVCVCGGAGSHVRRNKCMPGPFELRM